MPALLLNYVIVIMTSLTRCSDSHTDTKSNYLNSTSVHYVHFGGDKYNAKPLTEHSKHDQINT